jgi:hypothetical protein
MNKARLLSTAAIALTFGVMTTLGAATAQTTPNPEPAPAAQQNAPPAKIAPSINAGERKSAPQVTGQTAKPPEPGHVKADEKSRVEMKGAPEPVGAAAKSGADSKTSTTGQGAAAGSAKLSPEQRTKITTVIKKQNVKPVHGNFSINIGTRVPSTVHYYPLPVEVVTIYPEWRGYNYILVGNQILVIDPDTREIVAVLDA